MKKQDQLSKSTEKQRKIYFLKLFLETPCFFLINTSFILYKNSKFEAVL
ncbi:hypothetical protein FLB_08560 [Flavobacterium succinicans]|uniref:Uncharacterized protein n=1 Tax=Flavobacterium succinicans TaxID=29536 RepID=A0A199XTC9_9FLAO|nr:hypothetical protein FLB_08560 [Flavobacterium succinicans]